MRAGWELSLLTDRCDPPIVAGLSVDGKGGHVPSSVASVDVTPRRPV
jgi:hypothetical protein